MNLFQKIRDQRQNRINERNQKCEELLEQLSSAVCEAKSYFADQEKYIDATVAEQWKTRNYGLIFFYGQDAKRTFKKAKSYKALIGQIGEAQGIYDSLRKTIGQHNQKVTNGRIEKAYELLGTVEEQLLDRQQMEAVVMEAHSHLIIAGAGTGKTTTVVGKIKYLIKSGKYKPEDILVLSFTNASATEMSERINKESGCQIEASTFHRLGMAIITEVEGIKPKISKYANSLKPFIREQLKALVEDKRYVYSLSTYLIYNRVHARSEFEFHSEKEYKEYLEINPPITMLNEKVKSYGEMDIANFLCQNGVRYIYEEPYVIDTRTSEYGQYKPDFYLPDYQIYIEYFGINKRGEVPEWFSGKNGISAAASYKEGMQWKRKIHKENGTVLVESYSYEKFDGTLLRNLEDKLKEQGVIFEPKTPRELWNMVLQEEDGILEGTIALFETIIHLMKSNGYSVEQLRKIASTSKNSYQNQRVIDLIEPIYDAYNRQLSLEGEIDFNDMINQAAEYVRSGKYINPYSYIIVDEYQDISKARYALLAALRTSKDYDLFCVGDDWQSIYRFAGSDISYILDFEKYWGAAAISKIETTYRFTPSLIEISGTFIKQNPDQLKKNIRGKSSDLRFSMEEINGYNESCAMQFMAERIEQLPQNSSVYFIGRYKFDVEMIKGCSLFECQYDNINGFINIIYKSRKDLNMHFLTAHAAKGLQADYIFIINNKNAKMGFPSKIQDDAILELLLEHRESYPFAEERRLFYVALTRAKTKVYLITVKDEESVFALEMKKRYGDALREKARQRSGGKQNQPRCPKCGGRLYIKKGPYGEFWGCENYKKIGCKYTEKIKGKLA